MKLGRGRHLKHTKIEIIPMIDTMFFLLVFFLLSSINLAKINGIGANLPRESDAPKQQNDAVQMTIALQENGDIYVDKDRVTADQLGDVLKQKTAGKDPAKASVIISAEAKVKHKYVVRCIDEARNVGIVNFSIASPFE